MIIKKTQSHRIEQLTVKVQLHTCEKITMIIENLASKYISVFMHAILSIKIVLNHRLSS